MLDLSYIQKQIQSYRQSQIEDMSVDNSFKKVAFVPAPTKQAGAMPPGPPPPPPQGDPNAMPPPPPGGDPNAMMPPPPPPDGGAPVGPDPAMLDQMVNMVEQLGKGFESLEQEVNSLKQQQMDIVTKNAETQGMLNTILSILQKGSLPNAPQLNTPPSA